MLSQAYWEYRNYKIYLRRFIMKKLNLRKNILVAATGAALVMGLASQASAAPVFTIDPNAIPGNVFAINPFNADFVSGTTSELLTISSPTTMTGSGWAQFTSYSLGASLVSSLVSGLGKVDYGLYLTFSLADTLVSGSMGGANSVQNLTLLDFVLKADPGLNTTFTNANATTSTNATVGGTTADDIVLATGSLITGVAGFDSLGGAYVNAINSFAVCTGAGTADVGGTAIADAACANGTGSSYFSAPVPFYDLAFSEFNNTSQGIIRNGNLISITNATGGVDFNRVPEPATLGLLGLGLLGMGASLRKRKSA
jgi:PEP-CTERM motif